MAAATNSIDINRPVEQAYRFLANGLNNPQWRPAVTDIKLASGSPGTVGAVYKQRIKGPFGISIPADYRLVQAIDNFRIKFEVITGPARPWPIPTLGELAEECEPALAGFPVRAGS